MQTWPSPAKINLFLYILGRQKNNYHILQTLFQFLDYGDNLIITPTNNGKIRLMNHISGISYNNNLVIRAAKLLQNYCWPKNDTCIPGANIQLNKILPIGSGLGGGSSNAATTLIALNQQWCCHLDLNILVRLGAIIGSDVSVFIYGKTSIFEGIKKTFTPVQLLEKWYVVIIPPVNILTSDIFQDTALKGKSSYKSLKQLLIKPFYNDCEFLVRKRFPIINNYISWLSHYKLFQLTGTGSCIFAEFDKECQAYNMLSLVPKYMNGFVAKGVNTSPLHLKLLQ